MRSSYLICESYLHGPLGSSQSIIDHFVHSWYGLYFGRLARKRNVEMYVVYDYVGSGPVDARISNNSTMFWVKNEYANSGLDEVSED
ncbi:hypothetical protein L1887_18931 [Cichorium endivia]|nr:hypothetical protein L1887_18931 [Cichorium endivia]